MIGFEHYVSGGQIGQALIQDPEEAAYALREMADAGRVSTGEDIAEFLAADDAIVVCSFLRQLANQIEMAK